MFTFSERKKKNYGRDMKNDGTKNDGTNML